MTQKTIPFLDEQAYCPFYALDPALGLVAVSVLTTAQELGLRVAARLVGGQEVLLADGTALRRQKEVGIPLPASDTPALRTPFPPPVRLETRPECVTAGRAYRADEIGQADFLAAGAVGVDNPCNIAALVLADTSPRWLYGHTIVTPAEHLDEQSRALALVAERIGVLARLRVHAGRRCTSRRWARPSSRSRAPASTTTPSTPWATSASLCVECTGDYA